MAESLKQLSAKLDLKSEWKVDFIVGSNSLPFTVRDVRKLARAIVVAHKRHIREWNQKQYALKKNAEKQTSVTGKATETKGVLTNVSA